MVVVAVGGDGRRQLKQDTSIEMKYDRIICEKMHNIFLTNNRSEPFI
jgi:hypothetical protein